MYGYRSYFVCIFLGALNGCFLHHVKYNVIIIPYFLYYYFKLLKKYKHVYCYRPGAGKRSIADNFKVMLGLFLGPRALCFLSTIVSYSIVKKMSKMEVDPQR